jgi:glycosyltransferase involved in cell wall biosynthesis
LFDCLEGVRIAAQRLRAQNSPINLHLTVAGDFLESGEKRQFEAILKSTDMIGLVEYAGFVSGNEKRRALGEADLFCFPTYYRNENQPVNLIEAMAWGLPVLTTRWRSLPELLPADYSGLVEIQSPEQIADSLLRIITERNGDGMRQLYIKHYSLDQHLAAMSAAIRGVGTASDALGSTAIPAQNEPLHSVQPK